MSEKFQLFKALPAPVEDALRASIQRFGVLVPVVKDQHGQILDGFHRSRIADELGVDYRVDLVRVASDEEAREIAATLNAVRRQLPIEERREVVGVLWQLGHSQNAIAEALGVSQSTVRDDIRDLSRTTNLAPPERTVGQDGKTYPARRPPIVPTAGKAEEKKAAKVLGFMPPDAPPVVAADELMKAERRERRRAIEHTPARPDASLPDADAGEGRIRLLHGDFRDRLMELEPGSVDLIVTDPPYPKEDLPLWSDLGEIAARLLSPRGLLFAWSGKISLPEVMARLGEHLTYGWMFGLLLPGANSRIMGRHIIQEWKPVLAYSTGTWPSGEWGGDLLTSPARAKDAYEWQQNAEPARQIIERFSAPDGLVVDPFLGVGSFGVAARDAGRRFVGVELDAGRFRQATEVIL